MNTWAAIYRGLQFKQLHQPACLCGHKPYAQCFARKFQRLLTCICFMNLQRPWYKLVWPKPVNNCCQSNPKSVVAAVPALLATNIHPSLDLVGHRQCCACRPNAAPGSPIRVRETKPLVCENFCTAYDFCCEKEVVWYWSNQPRVSEEPQRESA